MFGVNQLPFEAQFGAKMNSEKNKNQFPMAAETVLRSTYMDKLWSGAGMRAWKWL